MDEITLDDKTYVSSKRAAQITGYAKDYVGQLCREGRVQARLVGRNWYVLETSIREHRFGAEEKKHINGIASAAQKNELQNASQVDDTSVSNAWERTNYLPEPSPESIPTIISPIIAEKQSSEINLLADTSRFEIEKPEIIPVSSKVVNEMQSAWHDWFARTNELTVSKEILLENEEETSVSVEEAVALNKIVPEVPKQYIAESFDSETTPITLERVTSLTEQTRAFDQNDETIQRVSLRRTYTAPERINSVPTMRRESKDSDRALDPLEGRIIRERRITKKRKSSLALRIVLLLVAVVVIGITIVGSGQIDSFLSSHNINYSPINYLGGESSFKKVN